MATARPAAPRGGAAPPVISAARAAARRFAGWLHEFGQTSQDPYDFLVTPLGARAKALYHRRRLLGAAAVAPFVALDLIAPRTRALVRKRDRYPIADAHFAMGFFALARSGEEPGDVDRGRAFLAVLEQSRSPGFADPAWGYPFDWPTRYGVFRAGWPLITTVPYAYEAFEAGFEATQEPAYLTVMEGVARFAAEHIPVSEAGDGREAAAYTPYDTRRVVNASAYRAFLLATAGRRFGRDDWLAAGRRNAAFVLASQHADGSWPYSTDGTDDFVDNFHTCLVLKNLVKVWRVTNEEDVRASVAAGYAFYLEHLLDEAGLPRPFARRPRLTLHRRDLYDYAEGINLAHLLSGVLPEAPAVLERLVVDLTDRWTLADGHFVTRELAVGRNTVPYHRWAQSQAFRALAVVGAGEG